MSLTDELNKPEYQSGSYAERFALLKSKTVPTLGQLKTGNLKHLETMIVDGLWRDKVEALKKAAYLVLDDVNASPEAKGLAHKKAQVAAGFHEALAEAKLARKEEPPAGHSINFADSKIQEFFLGAQHPAIALVTPAEVARLNELATWEKPQFPDVTLRDIIAHFEPSLVDVGDWVELDPGQSRQLRLKLTEATPEPTYIVVQMQENDGEWSEWYHATAMHGIHLLRPYTFAVPNNGLPRRMRWRGGEYRINGIVTAV